MAQANFVKGYYVDLKGDTVRGEAKVNPKKEIDNHYKIMFRDEKGAQRSQKPGKIKAYGYQDSVHYVSMPFNGEPLFFKVLTRGEIGLYKFIYEGLRMNKPVNETEYYITVPGKKEPLLVKEKKFKKQMADWMEDNPSLLESYGEPGEFDTGRAIDLINKYNAAKQQ